MKMFFFSLDVLSGDSIRVSCIGYQMQVLAADNVPDVIRLSQRESVLREITVVPVKNLLESVVIKLDRDFIKKNRTRSSFSFARLYLMRRGRKSWRLLYTHTVPCASGMSVCWMDTGLCVPAGHRQNLP